MADQPIDQTYRSSRARTMPQTPPEEIRTTDRRQSYLATLDKPLLVIVGLLVIIGSGMVFSTTFDWSLQERGSNIAIFLQDHMRNVLFGVIGMTFFALVDYRFWKRFAVWLLIGTVGALVAVLIFGDDTFGARRSLIAGRFQPGELAEFTTVVYMSAWLGAKNTRIRSIPFGLIPFGILVATLSGLVALQPDLSSAVIIGTTAVFMYFLAGARVWHLAVAFVVAIIMAWVLVQSLPYAQARFDSFVESVVDPTKANYHTQQAIIAFVNGGWFGRGLGQGEQKFGFLPAPHTDSIFAVIGEELGVVGASFVVLLFVAFVIRGFTIARNAVDPFGSLLSTGFTLWVAIQALLNIAVMTAVIPSSGLPLPFISYGGSALLVLMIGVGMMLSVSRVSTLREASSQRRKDSAYYDRGWGNGRPRVSRTGRRGGIDQPRPGRT